MSARPAHRSSRAALSGRTLLMSALAFLIAVAAVLIAVLPKPPPPSSDAFPAASTMSVFGVNMALYDGYDQLTDDPATRALLRSWNVPLVRLPLRATLPDSTLLNALQAIADIGAVPVVVLSGPGDLTPDNTVDDNAILTEDLHLLDLVKQVFDTAPVDVEYGNEEDYFHGVNAADYTVSWNAVVPKLKAAVPSSYKFVGPVLSNANVAYIRTFVGAADPRPDFISWHEYACEPQQGRSYCDQRISHWTDDAVAINAAEKAVIGTTLPFMITEWNADPSDNDVDEALYGDASFIGSWTTKAVDELKSLVPLGLVGAAIYPASNHRNFALLQSGPVLTPQGQAFEAAIRASGGISVTSPDQIPVTFTPSAAGPSGTVGSWTPAASSGGTPTPAGGGVSSPPAGSSPPPRPGTPHPGPGTGPSGPVIVGFEDGTDDGWLPYWGNARVGVTSAEAYAGTHALQVVVPAHSYAAVGTTAGIGALKPGDTVTFHVWTPGGSAGVRPFVHDDNYVTTFSQAADIQLPSRSGWATVTWTVPPVSAVHAIGLQITNPGGGTLAVDLDALTWP